MSSPNQLENNTDTTIIQTNAQEREDNTQLDEMEINLEDQLTKDNVQIRKKRHIDDIDENWTIVNKNGKRYKSLNNQAAQDDKNKIEVSITCKEALPKQFKLAKLLQANNINRISHIKYINQYKVMLQFESDLDLQKLINCTEFKEKNWAISKTMEVELTYGIIKNIELDCTEEEIIDSLTSDTEIISVKRLSRRQTDGSGWTESETIRVCFKGSSLPAYIRMYGVRINVEPYVYPVTQCSNCWKFGHYKKICPSKKIVCPKCSKNHECCEITSYKCVNCKGDHMALSKVCPLYEKEKKIRSIMSQFNCTYKKALTLYVPSSTPIPERETYNIVNSAPYSVPQSVTEHISTTPFQKTPRPLYSSVFSPNLMTTEATKSSADPVVPSTSQTNKTKKKKKQHCQNVNDTNISYERGSIFSDSDCDYSKEEEDTEKAKDYKKNTKTNKIRELLEKIKTVIFKKKDTIYNKIKTCFHILFEWFIQLTLDKIFDLSDFQFYANYGPENQR